MTLFQNPVTGMVTGGVAVLLLAGVLYSLYKLLGALTPPPNPVGKKTASYTGGKELVGRQNYFRTRFFQFAIYFLIFDVVAFVATLASFSPKWQSIVDAGFGDATPWLVLIYTSLVFFMFGILPRKEEELI